MENTDYISIQEAASILNTSSDYLVNLIESRQIASLTVGKEQKALRQEVLSYKETVDKKRMQVLDELVAEAEDLSMGY